MRPSSPGREVAFSARTPLGLAGDGPRGTRLRRGAIRHSPIKPPVARFIQSTRATGSREMIIWLNGRFLPEEEAVVSVFDRGFLFGDGLFETLRVHRGKPFCWAAHLERLQRGANFLGIKLPFAPQDLLAAARGLV